MDKRTTFWYGRVDPGYTYRYKMSARGALDLAVASDQETMIDEAAHDYHSNHDGWEARWPLTLALFADEAGPELARFTVERDVEPVFTAYPAPGVGGKTE
jgi:hypothetical protein